MTWTTKLGHALSFLYLTFMRILGWCSSYATNPGDGASLYLSVSRSEPGTHPGYHEHRQDETHHDAGRDGPLSGAGAVHLAPGGVEPVPGCQTGRIEEVPEHMECHHAQPQYETRLVRQQQGRTP
jgi:hypothetical protein